MAVAEPPRLGCGRSIDDVWLRIDEPPDDHERGCADCTAARASLTALHAAVDADRAWEVEHPDLVPGPRVKASIMDVARAEVRRGRRIPLEASSPGQTEADLSISEQAIAQTVRAAAAGVPGLRAGRVRVEVDAESDVTTGVEPTAVQVAVSVSMSVRTPLPAALARLRTAVAELVAERTGLRIATVDVSVEDVYDA